MNRLYAGLLSLSLLCCAAAQGMMDRYVFVPGAGEGDCLDTETEARQIYYNLQGEKIAISTPKNMVAAKPKVTGTSLRTVKGLKINYDEEQGFSNPLFTFELVPLQLSNGMTVQYLKMTKVVLTSQYVNKVEQFINEHGREKFCAQAFEPAATSWINMPRSELLRFGAAVTVVVVIGYCIKCYLSADSQEDGKDNVDAPMNEDTQVS